MKHLPFFISLLLFSLVSCHSSKKSSVKKSSAEDFESFYTKFHKDESFQMSRIKFPLEGKMVDESGDTKWTKQNWLMMKVKIYDIDKKKYKVEYKKSKSSFYQKFWIEGSGFGAEYRFELLNNKWYLMYALDQNL